MDTQSSLAVLASTPKFNTGIFIIMIVLVLLSAFFSIFAKKFVKDGKYSLAGSIFAKNERVKSNEIHKG